MNNINETLHGVGAALVTPFNADGSIDYRSLGGLIDYVIGNGVNYIVTLGTTAETPTLLIEEHVDISRFVDERVAGRVPVVVGVGSNSTAEVIEQLSRVDLSHATAILSITPYYNEPTQRGLYEHFRVVAGASPLPVILYNVPGRTGVNMLPETTLRLAREVPNIVGIKEASGNIGQIEQLLAGRPDGFMVISGDDSMALPLIRRGGDGVISVAADVFTASFMRAVNAAFAGDWTTADAEYARMDEAIEALFAEGNPVGVKTALSIKGLVEPNFRLPLVPASDELTERLRMLIERNGI